jgi:Protein of unknown function (DUF3592)
MNWGARTKMRLQFFAMGMTFLCPAFLIWQASDTKRQFASKYWPSVTGEVQGIDAKPWLADDKTVKFFGRVNYRYVVDGREYTTDLTDLGPGTKRSNRDAALADVSEYKPGMKVPVYYDPSDPGIGIIHTGIPTIHLLLLIGLCLGTIAGALAIFFTLRGWLREWRDERNTRIRQPSEHSAGVPPVIQVADLGAKREVFSPRMANTVAGFIISALLVVGGTAAIGLPLREAYLADWNLPVYVKTGWCWLAIGVLAVVGVFLAAGGIVLMRFSKALLSHRVELFANGFRFGPQDSAEVALWTNVVRVRETILYERPPILKGAAKLLLPKIASASYVIVTKSGKEYGFDGNSIKEIQTFAQVLRDLANRLSLPWETVEEHA